MLPINSLSSYTINIDNNNLMNKFFNTPSIYNPLGGIVNAINDPYNPVLTINREINPNGLYPMLNPIYNPIRVPYPGSYTDVNNDPTLRNQMTSYFYEEFIYWLAKNSRYAKLYNLLSLKDNNVIHEIDKDNKPEHKEAKLKFLLSLFDKEDIRELLEKFCRDNTVNWWDLKKEGVKEPLKNFIYVKVKSYLNKKLSK
jgi:hypothetical protein